MTAAGPGQDRPGTGGQRWLARLSVLLAVAAAVAEPVLAGRRSLPMLAVGLAAVAVSLASAYLFLARRGVLRWTSLAVFGLTPVTVVVVYAFAALLGWRRCRPPDGCWPGRPRAWPWPATGTAGACPSTRWDSRPGTRS